MDNINFSKIKQTTNTLDLKGYVFKVLAYWKLFLVSLVIAFVIAKFMSGYKPKRYSLSTTISVKEEANPLFSTGTSIAFNWGGASDEVETIRAILVSRSHNEKVVKRLQFYIQYLEEGKYRKKDVYGYTPFKIVIDTLKPQLYNHLIKVDLIDKEKLKISFEFEESKTHPLIIYSSNTIDNYNFDDLKFSREFKVGEKVELPFLNFTLKQIRPFEIGKSYFIKFNSFQGTVASNSNVTVSTVTQGASMLKLQKQGGNRARIVDYLNTSVEVLAEDKIAQKIAYAVKTKKYIETLFIQEEKKIYALQDSLGNYKVKNNIFDLSSQGTSIYNETKILDKEKALLLDYNEYLVNLRTAIFPRNSFNANGIPVPAMISIQDPKIPTGLSELILKSSFREGLRNSVTDNHPEVIKLDNEILILKNNLLENISSLIDLNNIKIGKLEEELEESKVSLKELPKKEQRLLNFQRDYSISEANYNYLKQKLYESGTVIAANVSDVKIIDPAKDLGQGHIYPKPGFNYTLALIFGSIIPLFFIIVRELLDNKIHTAEDITGSYEIPVLGVIGRNSGNNNLAVFERPKSSVAESFRAIRSNIQFLFKKY